MGSRAFVSIEDTDVALFDNTGMKGERIVKAVKTALRENRVYWDEPLFLSAKIFLAMVAEQKKSGEPFELGITNWKYADAEMVVAVNCDGLNIVVSVNNANVLFDGSFEEFVGLTDEEIGA